MNHAKGSTSTSGSIQWGEGNVVAALSWTDDAPVTLAGVRLGTELAGIGHPLVEISVNGEGRVGSSPHAQHRRTACGSRLRYQTHALESNDGLHRLAIVQRDPSMGLEVTSWFEQRSNVHALRTWTDVRNIGVADVALDFVASLVMSGFGSSEGGALDAATRVHLARNAWHAELLWQEMTLEQAGIVDTAHPRSPAHTTWGRFSVTNRGSWSSGDHLPMGALVVPRSAHTWLWQIEHNGGWHWEIGDHERDLFLVVSGPTSTEHDWRKRLRPAEVFRSVAVGLALSDESLHDAFATLTTYRRRIRRKNSDNEALPVVFNDYMNCLMGDPTEAKLLPLIDTAADVGAEYFVIDAGWYSDDDGWWDTVGEWTESPRRFPGGLAKVTDRIRARGMTPGLWIEPEVIGIHSPAVQGLPADAFFQSRNKRIVENGRYQLDFRHPATIEHMNAIIDRLVSDYGLGYFKFDYNINIGSGTDVGSESPGDGLLDHNRSYLAWLDGLFIRHPDLVIENCSSGGMRLDYAQLSRMSLQSTSDQTNHFMYAPIAASSPTGVAPEQAANWAYPQPEFDAENNAFTMVNALLGRVYLSGRIDVLTDLQRADVKDAITAYKRFRRRIPRSTPYWPLGLPQWGDPWISLALRDENTVLLAVWHRDPPRSSLPASVTLPIPWLADMTPTVAMVYPIRLPVSYTWDETMASLTVVLPSGPAAWLFTITS